MRGIDQALEARQLRVEPLCIGTAGRVAPDACKPGEFGGDPQDQRPLSTSELACEATAADGFVAELHLVHAWETTWTNMFIPKP